MPNTRSAAKRMRQNENRRVRNRVIRTRTRSFVKRARQAIEAGDLEAAQLAVQAASRELDRAVSKGILHRNNADRRKGRLMRQLVQLQTSE